MNRIDRLFAILTFLQSRKYVTAEQISEKFHISVRTVYRDIKALGESGIPVSFEQFKGYFIVQGYFLPPVSFSNEEANALLLMERFVSGFADKSIQKHYAEALNKVKNVLRYSQKEKIESLDISIGFQMPERFQNNYEYLAQLQNHISSKIILEINYTNNNQETTKRKIEPVGLVFYAFSWHVFAWCLLRNDYRDFKVSRITSIRATDQPFTKQDHISVAELMKQLPVSY